MSFFHKLFGNTSAASELQKDMSLRLLQIHEYMAYLGAGTSNADISTDVANICLNAARTVWPRTGLDAWDARPRTIEHFYQTKDGNHILAHVNADHADCFVIILYNVFSARAESYIVFDIGAKYAEPIFVCPFADYEGPATAELIASSIPNLLSSPHPFAILDISDGTFMQTYQDGPDQYTLEHQLVNIQNHYQTLEPVTAEIAIAAFQSYAFGKKEWASRLQWKKIELD
jgi:hypothetical protein